MKMTKKVLLTAAVMAAAAFGFMGCGEDPDDEYGMITKTDSNNYSVSFTNDTGRTQRAYYPTTLKHKGAQVEFKFTDVDVTSEAGVLGLIWELETKDKNTNARNFWVLGIRQKNGVPCYYISKFTNVTDINAENFGTKLKDNPAVETELVVAFANIDGKSWKNNADNTVTVYADVKAVNGGYDVQFYKTKADLEAGANGVLATPKFCRSDLVGVDTEPAQKDLAVYTNVLGADNNNNKKLYTLKGSWQFIGTYSQAEVAEPDAE